MKILVINGNTSKDITTKLEAESMASASTGTEIIAVTAKFGARVIGSRSQNAIAQHAVLDLVAHYSEAVDAILIAVSLDTALGAVRETALIPVVGMTEAGLLTACMLGDRLGVIAFGRRLAPVYEALIASYGLRDRLAGTVIIESSPLAAAGLCERLDSDVLSASRTLIDRDRVEVIILLGAVAAGIPRRLKDSIPVPILDCISCGILQAELLVKLDARMPMIGSFAQPPAENDLCGISEAIVRYLSRKPKDFI